MNRFIVQLNDGGFMNIPADRMELKENFLFAWRGTELIAMVDISAVICAGGKGTRAGFSENKLLKNALGIPVLERTLAAFSLPQTGH